MRTPTAHIFAMTPETLADWCEARGMARYRARQILEWVYRHGVIDPAQMTNLARTDRDVLAREMTFCSGKILRHQLASDGTQKLLVQWDDEGVGDEEDGHGGRGLPIVQEDPARQTECVMIPALSARAGRGGGRVRRTACISSQVGCPVGCRFCASGLGGLDGNLTRGRIVEQVWLLDQMVRGNLASPERVLEADPEARITNVVFMGMGEPLANFQAVTGAVRTICADWGMGLSARRVTISTVGLPRAIEKLAAQLDIPVTLALSLHAPTDDLRRELIPWAQYTTIRDLLAACRAWFEKTGREITLEYILLGGVNDRPEHAQQLAALSRSIRANVNLIRYNEVDGLGYVRPRTADVRRFQEILRARGVSAHIRASRGRDISAACGQLRHESASGGRIRTAGGGPA